MTLLFKVVIWHLVSLFYPNCPALLLELDRTTYSMPPLIMLLPCFFLLNLCLTHTLFHGTRKLFSPLSKHVQFPHWLKCDFKLDTKMQAIGWVKDNSVLKAAQTWCFWYRYIWRGSQWKCQIAVECRLESLWFLSSHSHVNKHLKYKPETAWVWFEFQPWRVTAVQRWIALTSTVKVTYGLIERFARTHLQDLALTHSNVELTSIAPPAEIPSLRETDHNNTILANRNR